MVILSRRNKRNNANISIHTDIIIGENEMIYYFKSQCKILKNIQVIRYFFIIMNNVPGI